MNTVRQKLLKRDNIFILADDGENPKATYACINYGEALDSKEIERQAVYLNGDTGKVLDELGQKTGGSEFASA